MSYYRKCQNKPKEETGRIGDCGYHLRTMTFFAFIAIRKFV